MMPAEDFLRARLAPYLSPISSDLSSAIGRYLELLEVWNVRIHLTSLKDRREILERHFGESLFALGAVGITNGRLADVGSGGGFPGLALKLGCPELKLTLIESSAKKAAFLAEVVRALSLHDVNILRSRFEDISDLPHRPSFITARALGKWNELLRWSGRQLSPGGNVVLWLGIDDARSVSKYPGWEWLDPIIIPKSQRRVLLVGRRA